MKKLNEVRQSIERFGRKTIDGSTEKLNEASVARCEDNQDYISSLKMLPEK